MCTFELRRSGYICRNSRIDSQLRRSGIFGILRRIESLACWVFRKRDKVSPCPSGYLEAALGSGEANSAEGGGPRGPSERERASEALRGEGERKTQIFLIVRNFFCRSIETTSQSPRRIIRPIPQAKSHAQPMRLLVVLAQRLPVTIKILHIDHRIEVREFIPRIDLTLPHARRRRRCGNESPPGKFLCPGFQVSGSQRQKRMQIRIAARNSAISSGLLFPAPKNTSTRAVAARI